MTNHRAVFIGVTFLTVAVAVAGCGDALKGGGRDGGGTGGSSSGGITGTGTGGSSSGGIIGTGTGGSSAGGISGTGAGGSSAGGTGGGGTCSGAAPCGGALDGTWQMDSVCTGDLTPATRAQLGLPAECSDSLESVSIDSMRGTLTYSVGTESSDLTMTLTMQLLFTQACLNAMAGTPVTLNASTCTSMQQSLASSGKYSTATCSYSSAACRCVVSGDQSSTNSTAYTVAGDSIVYTDGSDPVSYCVSGTTLTERQTSSTDFPGVTMVATLHRVR